MTVKELKSALKNYSNSDIVVFESGSFVAKIDKVTAHNGGVILQAVRA